MITKQQFCQHVGITESQYDGTDPTVGESLYLDSVTSIPEGFNPTVGGSLCLNSLTSIPEGFNPTVGGYLYLNSLTSIPEGFNPTVGGSLCLNSLTSIPEGFNPTVGRSLCLNSVTSIPEGFNPTVGGSLYLGSSLSAPTKSPPRVLTWQDGEFCRADGIFGKVVNRRETEHGTVWLVEKLNGTGRLIMVEQGEHVAHGKDLHAALIDLRFKQSARDTSGYQEMSVDDSLPFDDAVVCYRVITGACQAGVQDFFDRKLPKPKAEYTIAEIIEFTADEYGGETFARFFTGADE